MPRRGSALAPHVMDQVEQFVPMAEEKALDQVVAEVPEQHRHLVHEAMRHASNHYYRYFAAAVAATLVREQMQPNSAVTLYPAGLLGAGGAPTKGTPGVVYPLVPIVGGLATAGNNYQFVRGQRFFGILTQSVDSTAGWYISQNSLKLATDAISGLAYGDVSFSVFEQDVVAGRLITGEYERHEFLEEVSFFASAVLYNAASQYMTCGLTVQFFDERCANRKYFDLAALRPDFPELVREIMAEVNAGIPAHRLGKHLLRHHHHAHLRSLASAQT